MRNPFLFFDALVKQPLWVPVWVALLALANISSLFFWSDPLAKLIFITFLVSAMAIMALFSYFGFALIFLPTYVPMNYWMDEPGFTFIFEFPMVLAPSIVIPIFISLNLLHAWGIFVTQKKK